MMWLALCPAAALCVALGWYLGRSTAHVRPVVVGATREQDDAAFLADERARFDALIADLDIPDDHNPRTPA
ncbi:hypothetical protein [Streptomyces sp. NPDC002845]